MPDSPRQWTLWICPGCGSKFGNSGTCNVGHPLAEKVSIVVVEESRLREVEAEAARHMELRAQMAIARDEAREALAAIVDAADRADSETEWLDDYEAVLRPSLERARGVLGQDTSEA